MISHTSRKEGKYIFSRPRKHFINRSKGSGTHWVTVSNINCLNDEIMVYDSAFDDLPLDEQIVISELVGTDRAMK